MKSTRQTLLAVATAAALAVVPAMAQQTPLPPPAEDTPAVPATPAVTSPANPPQPMSPAPPPDPSRSMPRTGMPSSATVGAASADDRSVTYRGRGGKIVTIRSHAAKPPMDAGPAPAFAQLDSNGNGSVDTAEAAAYPLLANDFQYADGSGNRAVSQSEYKRWVGQP